jgi:DNA-binding transcriptional MocR family regulator
VCRLLADQLPDWRFAPPAGGLSLWVELPCGSADAFAPHAARHGVVFLPGGAASVDDAHPRHLRLSFALPPDRLTEAVGRLRAAWADYVGEDRSVGVAVAG